MADRFPDPSETPDADDLVEQLPSGLFVPVEGHPSLRDLDSERESQLVKPLPGAGLYDVRCRTCGMAWQATHAPGVEFSVEGQVCLRDGCGSSRLSVKRVQDGT